MGCIVNMGEDDKFKRIVTIKLSHANRRVFTTALLRNLIRQQLFETFTDRFTAHRAIVAGQHVVAVAAEFIQTICHPKSPLDVLASPDRCQTEQGTSFNPSILPRHAQSAMELANIHPGNCRRGAVTVLQAPQGLPCRHMTAQNRPRPQFQPYKSALFTNISGRISSISCCGVSSPNIVIPSTDPSDANTDAREASD